jgi:hypothetical protein
VLEALNAREVLEIAYDPVSARPPTEREVENWR